MVTIHVTDREGSQHKIQAEVGQPLMWTLCDNNLDVEAVCAGQMSCMTCHIFVAPDWIERAGKCAGDEADLLEEQLHFRSGSRLSCQIIVTTEMEGMQCAVAPSEG